MGSRWPGEAAAPSQTVFYFWRCLLILLVKENLFSPRIFASSLMRLWHERMVMSRTFFHFILFTFVFYLVMYWYSRKRADPFITFCIIILLRKRLDMRSFVIWFSSCVLANTLLGITNICYLWPFLRYVSWVLISTSRYAEHASNGGSS